jgi:hypothetical protein
MLPGPHRRRLREIWRSAGWPCHDPIELDLLAGGLLTRCWDDQGRETLRVSDAGIQALAAERAAAQRARGAHEALIGEVVRDLQRAGRLAWRGLSLRSALADGAAGPRWVVAMPDVFSIRHTSVEAYLEPTVHEIKVSRADLLSDLRSPTKGQAYAALSSQCWYVLKAGIAEPEEVPAMFGVMVAGPGGLETLRPAPRRPSSVGFSTWMSLARSVPAELHDAAQPWLGLAGEHPETPTPAEGAGVVLRAPRPGLA